MSEQTSKCEICGEPMPAGEGMFKSHGYSGPCPKPPLPRKPTDTERLDWLEKHPRLAEIHTEDGVTTDGFLYGVSGASGVRLRDIIDACIDAEDRP
jgi:hypothetical protein